ncbi:hypothetical protein GOBAR_AA21382 [Gossypium barbadense]|uniref:DUF4283 domain-containing protein n=1 Tax=Gossypium barbadense TaxID=3634 RepID=A0A2P5X7F7_GOSBA|nr:hypothetical protein GOBAR_AA21382 [Gossypium barbadense]
MDLENYFYLVHLQDESDYNKAVWIKLPGLPEGYYSDFLIRVIGQTVGPVVKLDVHTDYARRGRFAWLAVCVDLRKLLVSKMVVERWRGRNRDFSKGRNDIFRGLAGGSRFEALGVNEGEIFAMTDEINGNDKVMAEEKTNGERDMGLAFLGKYSQVVEEVMIMGNTDGIEVSGAKADGIIVKIGYLNSFRAEVVHVKIHSTMSSDHFFCFIIYASLHVAKGRELWHFLSSLVVSVEEH